METNKKIITEMNTKINSNQNHFTVVKNKNIFQNIRLITEAGSNGSTVLVPHVCNNINAFGAGFAGQVSSEYPYVKANFHLLANKAKLGTVQFVETYIEPVYKHKIIFANMIAQNKTISSKNPRPLNYGALVYCMSQVRTYIKELQKKSDSDSSRIEIHAPRFGCGLAGGNWEFVSDLIKDIWIDIPVFIYILGGNKI